MIKINAFLDHDKQWVDDSIEITDILSTRAMSINDFDLIHKGLAAHPLTEDIYHSQWYSIEVSFQYSWSEEVANDMGGVTLELMHKFEVLSIKLMGCINCNCQITGINNCCCNEQ